MAPIVATLAEPHDRARPTADRPHRPPATGTSTVDDAPPTRSRVTAGLAVLARAATVEKTLYAVTAVLVAGALSMWWPHRRRTAAAAPAGWRKRRRELRESLAWAMLVDG